MAKSNQHKKKLNTSNWWSACIITAMIQNITTVILGWYTNKKNLVLF